MLRVNERLVKLTIYPLIFVNSTGNNLKLVKEEIGEMFDVYIAESSYIITLVAAEIFRTKVLTE